MKLCFDTCFYCRPFDNQKHRSQESVEAEIIAIKGAVELCKVLGFDIIGTPAVEREIGMIRDDMKRQDVRDFYDWAINDFVGFNDVIYARAQEIRGMANIKNRDSYHIALAEAAGAAYLLTVDVRLISAASKLDLKTKVINPINFLQEFAEWARLLM